MTQSLKKLALSLVIATSVATTSFADGSGIFDQLEGSGIHQNRPNFDVSTIFEKPVLRKLDDSFNLGKIAESRIDFNTQDDIGSFLGEKPKSSVEVVSSLENEIFALPEDTAEKMAKRKQEVEDRKRAEKLAEDNAVANQMLAKFLQEQDAKRAAAEAPSTLRVLGGYAYSAGEMGFNLVDYAVRSWPGAYLATYTGIELLEEGIANVGYYATAGLAIWYSGGNVMTAEISGGTAYYAIKGGFKVAHTVFPCYDGAIAALAADKVQKVIGASLDFAYAAAPVVADVAISGAKMAASGASYAAPVVTDVAYNVASTAYSATSSAVSFIRSFWG